MGFEMEGKVSKMDTKFGNKVRRLGGEQLTQTSGQKAFDVQSVHSYSRLGRDRLHLIVLFF